jgi:hypothetical protein
VKVKTPRHIMIGKAFDCNVGPIEFGDERQRVYRRVVQERLPRAIEMGRGAKRMERSK